MSDLEVVAVSAAVASAGAAVISASSSHRSCRFAERSVNDVRVRITLGTRFDDRAFFPFGVGTAGERDRSEGETGIVLSIGNATARSIKLDSFDLRLGKKRHAFSLPASVCWTGGSPSHLSEVTVESGSVENFYIAPSVDQKGAKVIESIPFLEQVYACGVDRWRASSDQLSYMKYQYFCNISPSRPKATYHRLRHWFARN